MSNQTITIWANRAISVGFYLLAIIVPIILTPWNYELFEYNKMLVVYVGTVVIAAAWIIKMAASGSLKITRTPLDLPLLLFLSSQIISTTFSLDSHVSWFGYYSRFNGGLLSVISYIVLYYAFVSNWTIWNLTKLIKVTLTSATVVALWGVAEHFGIDKHLWVQDVQNRVFSTLGQPNWLAAYLVALMPLSLAASLESFRLKLETRGSKLLFRDLFQLSRLDFWVWSSVSYLFFLVLLYTKSRSGLFAFVSMEIIFWVILVFKSKNRVALKLPLIFINAVFLVILFFSGTGIESLNKYFSFEGWRTRLIKPQISKVTTAPYAAKSGSTLLEYGGTESGTIRKYVWQAALTAWNSSVKTRMIGTGTETFAFAFYQFKPQAHNLTSEWDFLYNKAHNEYLNYLATTGAFGLGSYLLLIGAFIFWFIRNQIVKSNDNEKNQTINNYQLTIIKLALFAGWSSILVANFFGFSVVIMQLFLFLFPAFTFVTIQQFNNLTMREAQISLKPAYLKIVTTVTVAATVYLLFTLGKLWYADTLFAAGYRGNRASQFGTAEPYLARAVALNPGEPLYHDELSSALAGLSSQLIDQGQATGAADLAKQSLAESDKALSVSPKNVNFWKTRTKIFYAFSTYLPEMNAAAIEALNQAASLSPLDPKIYYNLAVLSGRQNDNNQAIEYLKKTIDLKPNYRDAYHALYVFYNEVRKPELARTTLEEYLEKVGPNDKDFLQRLGR